MREQTNESLSKYYLDLYEVFGLRFRESEQSRRSLKNNSCASLIAKLPENEIGILHAKITNGLVTGKDMKYASGYK